MSKKVERVEGQPGPKAKRSLTSVRRTTYTFSGESDDADIMEELAGRLLGFDSYLTAIEDAARHVLRDHGLPTDPMERISTDVRGSFVRSFKPHEAPLHSQPWFAQQWLVKVAIIRGGLERGDALLAAGAALELGRLLERAGFKELYEADTARGIEIVESASKGGQVRARSTREQYRERDDRIRAAASELKPSLTDSAKARKLALDFDLSVRTIRRIIST